MPLSMLTIRFGDLTDTSRAFSRDAEVRREEARHTVLGVTGRFAPGEIFDLAARVAHRYAVRDFLEDHAVVKVVAEVEDLCGADIPAAGQRQQRVILARLRVIDLHPGARAGLVDDVRLIAQRVL